MSPTWRRGCVGNVVFIFLSPILPENVCPGVIQKMVCFKVQPYIHQGCRGMKPSKHLPMHDDVLYFLANYNCCNIIMALWHTFSVYLLLCHCIQTCKKLKQIWICSVYVQKNYILECGQHPSWTSRRYEQYLRRYCTSNQKLAWFVLYVKIINTFMKNNKCTL